jgi:hypothetical protein
MRAPPPESTASDVLAGHLSDVTGQVVSIDDVVLPHEPLTAPVSNGPAWLARLTPVLDEVSRFDGVHACLGVPARTTEVDGGRPVGEGSSESEARAAVLAAAARVPDGRAGVVPDALWSLRVQVDPCPEPDASTDASTDVSTDAGPPLEGGPGDGGHD